MFNMVFDFRMSIQSLDPGKRSQETTNNGYITVNF